MARRTNEYSTFNKAMNAILRADPKAVKEAMEADKQANAEKRKAKRKPSAFDPSVSAKGD
jgi:hypothetical protein